MRIHRIFGHGRGQSTRRQRCLLPEPRSKVGITANAWAQRGLAAHQANSHEVASTTQGDRASVRMQIQNPQPNGVPCGWGKRGRKCGTPSVRFETLRGTHPRTDSHEGRWISPAPLQKGMTIHTIFCCIQSELLFPATADARQRSARMHEGATFKAVEGRWRSPSFYGGVVV